MFSTIVSGSSSSAESVNGARGYIKNLNNIDFTFLTTVYNGIWYNRYYFRHFTKKSLDVGYGQQQVNLAKSRICAFRMDEKCSELYRKAEDKLEVFLPPAKRFKFSEEQLTNFKALYFEIIDNISTQI